MAIRTIIRMGHPLLRQKAAPLSREEILSPETQILIQDMLETMHANNGIGIAAPQIGVSKQIALVGMEDDNERYPEAQETPLQVVINPKIKVVNSLPQGFWEGCLSVPGLRGYVERPRKIKVTFLDEKAHEHQVELDGFLATVFQHEIDHLYGKLYVDRIKDNTKLSFVEEFIQFNGDKSDLGD